jgi:hypothetical protein
VVAHPMDPGVVGRIEALKATIPRATLDDLVASGRTHSHRSQARGVRYEGAWRRLQREPLPGHLQNKDLRARPLPVPLDCRQNGSHSAPRGTSRRGAVRSRRIASSVRPLASPFHVDEREDVAPHNR